MAVQNSLFYESQNVSTWQQVLEINANVVATSSYWFENLLFDIVLLLVVVNDEGVLTLDVSRLMTWLLSRTHACYTVSSGASNGSLQLLAST